MWICSRNTAQKQWDETLVLVLGGIARILRSFFLTFRSLNNFWAGEFSPFGIYVVDTFDFV